MTPVEVCTAAFLQHYIPAHKNKFHLLLPYNYKILKNYLVKSFFQMLKISHKSMHNLLALCYTILYRVITLLFSANHLAWRVEMSITFRALLTEFKVMKLLTQSPLLPPPLPQQCRTI